MSSILTQAGCCNEADGNVGRLAGRVQRLHQIVGKGQRNHSLTGWFDQQDGRPQADEGQKATEGLQDVGVAGSRLGDGGAEFCVAQGAEDGKDASEGPDQQRQPVRRAVHEHALRRDEDAGSDHVAHNEADSIRERNFSFHVHFLFLPRIPLQVLDGGSPRTWA